MNTIERRKRDEDERQDWKEERSRKRVRVLNLTVSHLGG